MRRPVTALTVTTVTAALLLVDVVPLPGAAPAAPTRASVQTLALATAGPAGPVADVAGEAAVLTAPLETEDFTVMGLTWAGDPGQVAPGTTVQVRVRQDAEWLAWEPLGINDSGPDPGTDEHARAAQVVATEPLVAPGSDGIQVRLLTPDGEAPDDLRAVMIDPGTTPAEQTTSQSSVLSGADAAVARPAVVSRASWGAKASSCTARYSSTVVAATVHHTAGGNSYTAAQSAGIVKGIQSYHQGTLGWCDIGYNFLVDKYGQVFEGRVGGIDRPVKGAHTGGFNDRTFGVSAIGNYQTAAATPALVSGIARVVGWKLALYGRSPHGTAQLVSAGGGTSRYASGSKVTVPSVLGHRDVGNTSCPGANLYAQLATIRTQAAAYQVSHEDGQYGDLYAVTASGASGKVELHADGRASSFRTRMLSVASGLSRQDPAQWRFFVGSYQGDTRPDLIAVQTSGTASGKVEVQVWSWASRYAKRVAHLATPQDAFVADARWQVDISRGSDGRADLVLVDTSAEDGTMDVRILSAASGYSDLVVDSDTAFHTGYGPGHVKMLMDDNRDLWLIKHGGSTGTGKMEFHVVSAASGYQRFTLHRGVEAELGPLTKWAFTTGDYTGDGLQDLYLLKVGETGSGRSEVHVLSGASQHRTFVLHRATSLPELPFPSWQVSIG